MIDPSAESDRQNHRLMALADFECPHGALPTDVKIECECFNEPGVRNIDGKDYYSAAWL